MKKNTLFLVLFISLIVSLFAAQTDADLSKQLEGKWVWIAHRHDYEITYNKDGTFQSVAENGKRKGTWKIKGGQLIAISKSGTNESKIEFLGKDMFELDGAFSYRRSYPIQEGLTTTTPPEKKALSQPVAENKNSTLIVGTWLPEGGEVAHTYNLDHTYFREMEGAVYDEGKWLFEGDNLFEIDGNGDQRVTLIKFISNDILEFIPQIGKTTRCTRLSAQDAFLDGTRMFLVQQKFTMYYIHIGFRGKDNREVFGKWESYRISGFNEFQHPIIEKTPEVQTKFTGKIISGNENKGKIEVKFSGDTPYFEIPKKSARLWAIDDGSTKINVPMMQTQSGITYESGLEFEVQMGGD